MPADVDRREFLVGAGLALASGAVAKALLEGDEPAGAAIPALDTWAEVRDQFILSPRWIHLGTFLLASHPGPVRKAIAAHRARLDANPVHYLHERGPAFEAAVLRAGGHYLGAEPAHIALTDSTTMGLGLLYTGLAVRAGQELLTTRHDFFATHDALRRKAERVGATLAQLTLYDDPASASGDEIVTRLLAAVTPQTRVVAITWVHSSTGVKLPVGRIADALAEVNANREEPDRILLCVDGVHGLGAENVTVGDLRCDFLVSGCHKWLHGPRGTGLVWGRGEAWPAASPTIPSFTDTGTPGSRMTPGGFHSFEHRWALREAFLFHQNIGKDRVAARIRSLAGRLKAGLAAMPHVTLHTPRAGALSAGIVCFSVDRLSPGAVVAQLRRRGIVATVTPYEPPYARVAPGIVNFRHEVDAALRAIRALR